MFVPSGGMLGFLSIVVAAGRRHLAFYHAALRPAWSFLAITAVAVPDGAGPGLSLVAQDSHGPAAAAGVPTSDEVLPDSPAAAQLRQLVGKVGMAKTVMLPSGAVLDRRPDDRRVSEGMAIEAGQRVRVVEVRGNRVVVRPGR